MARRGASDNQHKRFGRLGRASPGEARGLRFRVGVRGAGLHSCRLSLVVRGWHVAHAAGADDRRQQGHGQDQG